LKVLGTAPDFFAWEKWKLGWIDDDQVSCVSASGSSEHTIAPLETPGGVKMISIKLNDTTALNMELRTKAGVDVDTCSQGLLFYTVNTALSSGRGPLAVIDPRSKKSWGCNPSRGGPLTGAAIDYSKGEKEVSLPQYGVKVDITGINGGTYKVNVQYSEKS
jgi:hypothetical protein